MLFQNTPPYICYVPTVSVLNHGGQNYNLDFSAIVDEDFGVVHLFAFTVKHVAAGSELTADYLSESCPRPNFINPAMSSWWPKQWSGQCALLPSDENS